MTCGHGKGAVKNLSRNVFAIVLISVTLNASSPIAQSFSCDMLSSNLDDARTKLKRAANETDFDSAKHYARRAKSALEDAAYSARDCGCDYAANELDAAAMKARRARDADDPGEFTEALNKTIKYYNSGLEALQKCVSHRR